MYKFRAVHRQAGLKEVHVGEKVAKIVTPGFIYDSHPGEVFKWKNHGQDIVAIDQFIGLYDKHKTEIYTGDLISVKLNEEHQVGVVIYDETKACFSFKCQVPTKSIFGIEKIVVPLSSENLIIETVVGNIYSIPV